MRLRATRRWLAATGIAAAVVAGLPVSAAAEPSPTLAVVLSDTLFAPGSPGTVTEATVFVSEPTTVHNLTIQYDVSDITALADVAALDPGLCPTAGNLITCTFDEAAIDEWGGGFSGLALAPKAGAAVGDEGDLKVTVSADGLAAVSDTAKVSIGEGVDLAAEAAPDVTTTPGGTYSEKLGVQNVGDVTAHGAVLALFGDPGILAGSPRFSNCTYQGDEPRVCVFDTDLAPDKSYGITYPFTMRSDVLAPGNQFMQFQWMTPAEWSAAKAYLQKLGLGDVVGEPGNGPALSLAEKAKGELEPVEVEIAGKSVKQVDEKPWDNGTDSTITVTGDNSADVAAVGDRASGAAGVEVEVKLGMKNNGPASITTNRSGEGFAAVKFTVPPGASATDAPDDCAPSDGDGWDWDHPGRAGAAKYLCFPGLDLSAGEQILFAFKLRIDTATPNAKGKVELVSDSDDGKLPHIIDSNPNNNVAYVVLNPTAPESPGDDNDGGLPVTGTPVAIVAGAGLVVAVFGFVLFRMARRRRLTEV